MEFNSGFKGLNGEGRAKVNGHSFTSTSQTSWRHGAKSRTELTDEITN